MGFSSSFFSVAQREYEKLNFTAESAKTATVLIYMVALGIILASLCAFYQQRVPGRVVRALLRANAHTEESAKTAEELGVRRRSLAMLELRRGTVLRQTVRVTEEETPRYYIPEDLKYRAEIRFDKKGNELPGLIITIILSLAVALLLVKALPLVLGMIDNLLK